MIILLLNAGTAMAATITVTTIDDNTTANDGECTLREAILNANVNNDSTSGDCAAGSAAVTDRIVFDLALQPSTISISSELPSITDTVEIDGHTDDECTAAIPDRGTYAVALDGSNAGSSDGLRLMGGSDGSTIRGLNIRNFERYGIFVHVSDDHVIECNFLGTDETGSSDQGNGIGILTRKSSNVTYGGTGAGDGNLISGNIEGLHFTSGTDRGGHRIQGNFIGTNKAGTDLLTQNTYGIVIDGGSLDITIGGAEEGAGNLISGNNPGVLIRNTETGGTITFPTTGHLIRGNRIGTDKDGTGDLGNRQAGIVISGASDTTIGGTGAGEGNTIAGNAEGVVVTGDATGVRISGNSIFDNDGVGIDLDNNGRTTNDGGNQDADSGANNRQNFPTLESFIRTSSGEMVVSFRVRSSPSHTAYPVTVELFEADSNDEEGRIYLGQVSYAEADADKIVSTTFTSEVPVSDGVEIVATATDAEGNTSEFSSGKTTRSVDSCLLVDSTEDVGLGSLRQAILCANANPGTDTIHFDPGPGSYVIKPSTELPTITDPVVIDGNLGISGGNPCSSSIDGRTEYRVAIDGGGQAFHGLRLGAGSDGSTLEGLNIRGFGGVAVLIQESSNNTVACNFIGTNAQGMSAAGNGIGVFIFGSSNTIGGLDSRDGNLISGHDVGVNIFGMGSSGNQILGNQIGTDKNGSNAV
ncbi:MAG: right-handed parallel beta-helix repeat-containing protein, partial [Holophagales bacterium]|nr:right-handed parallel beta-helix repeat-containing protein [Holophagales bacterium]